MELILITMKNILCLLIVCCYVDYSVQQGDVDCGLVEAPIAGQVIRTGTTVGSTATFRCQTGYQLSGSSLRECLEDGTWSGEPVTCTVYDCGPLTNPANGIVTYGYKYNPTTYNKNAIYECNAGYVLNGQDSRVCQADGTWSEQEPTCQAVDCGSLSHIANGQVILQGTTYSNSATYSCNIGYKLNDLSNRTCQADGTWNGTQPTCQVEAVDCSSLSNITNGQVILQGTTYMNSATYSCDIGYKLNGQSNRTCQADGTWNGAQPTCQEEQCEDCSANALIMLPCKSQVSSVCRSCRSFWSSSNCFTYTCLRTHTSCGCQGYSLVGNVCEAEPCTRCEDLPSMSPCVNRLVRTCQNCYTPFWSSSKTCDSYDCSYDNYSCHCSGYQLSGTGVTSVCSKA